MQPTTTGDVFSFRQEVFSQLFNLIKRSESGYVISGPGMGKTRLLSYILRDDVQRGYLEEKTESTLLVTVNSDLVSTWSNLGLYELMLQALMMECGNKSNLSTLQAEFARLDTEVIIQQNELLALRYLQLAVRKICQTHRICFLFDEFDHAYQSISTKVFSSLRGIRDENKYRVSYILFLRQIPSQLRSPSDNESFHELISRSLISLGPYNRRDALLIIPKLEVQLAISLMPAEREWLYEVSGGHIGLVQALLTLYRNKTIDLSRDENLEQVIRHNRVQEECTSIWKSLSDEERVALKQFEQTCQIGSSIIEKLLRAKGLLQNEDLQTEIFSPLFRLFVKDVQLPESGIKPARLLKVFLCHSSHDKPFVRMLYQKLCSLAYVQPWLDENNLFPGDDWNYEIRKAIEDTHVVIVCISSNSITKEGYIQKEIKHVLDVADEKPEGTIFVIPVRIEDCEIPRRLSQWHWLNYSDEGAFDKLILSLKKRAQTLGIDIM